MKSLSRWAHRHTRLAICLIIVCECITAHNGFVLGAELLLHVPVVGLFSGVGAVILGIVWLRTRYRNYGRGMDYTTSRWLTAGAFGANFMLALLLGGTMAHQVSAPASEWAAYGSRRVEVVTDTLPEVQPARRIANRTDYYVQSEKKDNDKQTGKRIGYVLLFIISAFLFTFSFGLSCSLLCSGYGFLALLTLILGFGLLAGGVYFLTRSVEVPLLPVRELPEFQRRKLRRRFWKTWALLIGVSVVLWLALTAR